MRRTVAVVAAVGVLAGLGGTALGMGLAHDSATWGPHAGAATSMMGSDRTAGRPVMGHGWRATSEASWLREMVAHHLEAIAAARELARSDRPAMRAFGQRIVADQSAQVREMEGWLEDWYPDEASDDPGYEPMMRDLSDLAGDRLDEAFLRDMLGHHMAAVMMAQQLLVRGTAEHDAVADLAQTIRHDQSREIRWMRGRLVAWFGDARSGWCGTRA